MTNREPLIAYRLRTVRTGVWATFLVIAGLVVYPFLPRTPPVDTAPYLTLMGVAVLGAVAIVTLPWERLFERGVGMRLMYLWSILDIAIITAAIAFSGGARSEFFWVYVLTSFFMASSYPPRAQVALLGFTLTAYLTALSAMGEPLVVGDLLMRFAVLGTLVFMTSFLSRELIEQIRAHRDARAESERRAALLAAVARSGEAINRLSSDEVLQHVVDSVAELGFEACNFDFFDPDADTYHVSHAHGLPHEYVAGEHPAGAGMPGIVRDAGETVVVDDYSAHERAIPALRRAGFRSAIASPVRVEGRLEGILVAGSRRRMQLADEEVEAFEILAAHAGRALENARAFEEERREVERLSELDRFKQEFVSSVSHELRTPLTIITGLGETLTGSWNRMDDEQRRELVSRINANAVSLDSVISSLLDLSRLESGHLEVHPEPVDVAALVGDLTERLGSLLLHHDFRVDIPTGLAVTVDAGLLERVLENLLSNASKYTPEGTRVVLSAAPSSEGKVVVAVEDEGPGIPPEEQEHLGERYYRGEHETMPHVRGTGLGLAFVREILELHGSELDIWSEVGRGSRFSFTLPRADEDAELPRQQSWGTPAGNR